MLVLLGIITHVNKRKPSSHEALLRVKFLFQPHCAQFRNVDCYKMRLVCQCTTFISIPVQSANRAYICVNFLNHVLSFMNVRST